MDQGQALESENLLPSISEILAEDRTQRFLIGFLLAMALFLIAAGVAEVLLARNEACLVSLSGYRISPNPNEACMSEFGIFLAQGISRGVIGALSPATPVLLTWLLMGVIYGLIGGGLAQFSVRIAVVGFVAVLAVLLLISTVVGFMSQFIVLS